MQVQSTAPKLLGLCNQLRRQVYGIIISNTFQPVKTDILNPLRHLLITE